MHLQENTLFDFDIRVKVTQNIGQHHLNHLTLASAKFEVAMPNSLGGDAFTRNILFDLDLGHTKHRPVPSTPA